MIGLLFGLFFSLSDMIPRIIILFFFFFFFFDKGMINDTSLSLHTCCYVALFLIWKGRSVLLSEVICQW